MKTIWSKITRRTALLRARYHYERRQENLEARNVEERLHPRLRGRFQAPAYYTQLFKTWLNESPHDPRVYKKEYVTAGADALRMGKIELFGKELDTAGGVDWHKDPLFNVAWPRKYVGALSGDQRGSDAVVLWHLNRMMFLLDASYACRVAGDEEFGRRWLGWVDSWVEQNPFMVGMNWRSPLEIGTRLVAWSVGLKEIGFALTIPEAALARIIHSLIRQAEYVAEHLPHRDPPNNHLIGEAATLYTFAVLWPVLEKSKAWRGECENILKEEMKRQVLPDGMHFENAFNYHAYVLDFYLLYVYARCLEGEKPDLMLLDGITQLAKNLLAFRSPSGRVPRFGDDSLTEFLILKPLREIESRRFTESHTMTEIVRPEFAEVLAGQDWGMDLMQIGMPATSSIHCRDSGFSAFRAKSSHLVYAAGPEHPRPFSDGHLHSEAGSFELEIAGVPVFIDSGTYLYGYDGASREHFRGARAHNTLLIDDLDPMTGAGTFKWEGIKRGRTIWFSSQGDYKAVGSRQVLPSSRDEFYHERILVQLEESVWILVDRLSAPHCDADGALHRSRVLFHTPLPPDRFELLDGMRLGMRLDVSDETPAGSGSARRGAYILHGFSSAGYGRQLISDRADRRSWYSPAYGELRYGTTIDVCVDFMESLTLVHSFAGEDVRVACHPREDNRVAIDVERENKQDRLTVYFMPTRIDWNGKVLEESR